MPSITLYTLKGSVHHIHITDAYCQINIKKTKPSRQLSKCKLLATLQSQFLISLSINVLFSYERVSEC